MAVADTGSEPMPVSPTEPAAERLREAMVDHIAHSGYLRTAQVEAALRRVPRHRFLPGTDLEAAYADGIVNTKFDDEGRPLSCASQPLIVAMMLEQLDAQPGHRVLEIGAGTGYNAALLAEIVGPTGHVTTIDIHADVADRARQALATSGYSNVTVIAGDGALGHPAGAPYDRIIVTVGPNDLPPTWTDQLAGRGRMVVPLHWRGQARSIVFEHQAGHLRSRSIQLCGFIPMEGQDQARSTSIDDGGQVTLHWDPDQGLNPDGLFGILNQAPAAVWSAATVEPADPFDGIWLRLTATEPCTCRINATPTAASTGLCSPASPAFSPAIAASDSLAYLARRPAGGDALWQLGAIGHGPTGLQLAERLANQIHAWDQDRSAQPIITVHPAGDATGDPLGCGVVTRPHTRMVLTY
jgi:protein-L-isoaspartate(D-aspartate) O-methyltransferase